MATEETATSFAERITGLEEENERLRAENERLRREREEAARAAKGAGGLAVRILLGRRLQTSFQAWLKAKSLRDPLPADETAELGAAIVRRWLRVGWWQLVLALGGAVTAGILIWQGLLIRGQIEQQQAQNDLIRGQIEQQATQIERQAADTLIVRRAQLLATIYEEECQDSAASAEATFSSERNCAPKSHLRAREEAVLAFVEIERNRASMPMLNLADLKDATFIGTDLSGAFLSATDLSGAFFNDADLSGAIFRHTDLRNAVLRQVNLRGADLSAANLSRADVSGADLTRTNLTQEQIDVARGDLDTRLPEGLTRPEHWTTQAVGSRGPAGQPP